MDKNITSFNDKGQRHGYFKVYYSNGKLYYKANFVNDKLNGYWEEYYYDGKLNQKTFYLT